MNTTILTVDRLKENTNISNAVDIKQLTPYISIVEEFHLIPIIGDEMYSKIIYNIEENTLEGELEELVNKYIIPFVSFYTWYEASTFLYIKTENKGLVKKFSDNSNSLDSYDFKMYRQSILDKAIMYKSLLQNKLRKDNITNPKKSSNSSGIFLGF